MTYEEAAQIWQSHRGEDMTPPIYETDQDLWNRTKEWLESILQELLKQTKQTIESDPQPSQHSQSSQSSCYHVLVASHAGIIRVLLQHLFSLDELKARGAQFDASRKDRLIIPNTSVTIVDFTVPVTVTATVTPVNVDQGEHTDKDGDGTNGDDKDAQPSLLLDHTTATLVELNNVDHLDQVPIHDD
jgi:broad specificity phosphatase PhoE